MDNFKKVVSDKKISFSDNLYDTLHGADALLLLTEWSEFRSPNFKKMGQLMNHPVIFDGKNIYNNIFLEKIGFKHFQVGVKL